MSKLKRSDDKFLITDSKGMIAGRNIFAVLPNPLGEIIKTDYTIALDTLNETHIDSIVYKDDSLKIFLKKNLNTIVEIIKNKYNSLVSTINPKKDKEYILPEKDKEYILPEKDKEYILKKKNLDDKTAEYNGAVVAKLTTMPTIKGITFYEADYWKLREELRKQKKNGTKIIQIEKVIDGKMVLVGSEVIDGKTIIFKNYDQSSDRIDFFIKNPSQQPSEYVAIVIALNNNMVFQDFRNNAVFNTNNYNFTIYKPDYENMNIVKEKLYGITTFSNGGGKRNNKKSKKNSKKPLKHKNNKSRKFARK